MRQRIEVKSGDRYGRLIVIKEVESHIQPNGKIRRKFKCLCDCGNNVTTQLVSLRSNRTKSCGCLQKEVAVSSNTTHGMKEIPSYNSWRGMKNRCNNPNSEDYKHYGGRGIIVCDRWLNSFENFLEDMGSRPYGYSIDRIDVNGNYELSNCKWATSKEQLKNRRPKENKL
jgi:hypothetical protein